MLRYVATMSEDHICFDSDVFWLFEPVIPALGSVLVNYTAFWWGQETRPGLCRAVGAVGDDAGVEKQRQAAPRSSVSIDKARLTRWTIMSNFFICF
ncbi:hypothetical protein VTK26DRAFT_321 [Humicola hyalothermophila]